MWDMLRKIRHGTYYPANTASLGCIYTPPTHTHTKTPVLISHKCTSFSFFCGVSLLVLWSKLQQRVTHKIWESDVPNFQLNKVTPDVTGTNPVQMFAVSSCPTCGCKPRFFGLEGGTRFRAKRSCSWWPCWLSKWLPLVRPIEEVPGRDGGTSQPSPNQSVKKRSQLQYRSNCRYVK